MPQTKQKAHKIQRTFIFYKLRTQNIESTTYKQPQQTQWFTPTTSNQPISYLNEFIDSHTCQLFTTSPNHAQSCHPYHRDSLKDINQEEKQHIPSTRKNNSSIVLRTYWHLLISFGTALNISHRHHLCRIMTTWLHINVSVPNQPLNIVLVPLSFSTPYKPKKTTTPFHHPDYQEHWHLLYHQYRQNYNPTIN